MSSRKLNPLPLPAVQLMRLSLKKQWGASTILGTATLLAFLLNGCFSFRQTPFDYPHYPEQASFVGAIEGYQSKVIEYQFDMLSVKLRDRYADQRIVVVDHYLFAAQCGLTIFDVSIPEQLTVTGNYWDVCGVDDLVVENGRAYLAARDSGVTVLDVSNPSAPQLLGKYEYSHEDGKSEDAAPFSLIVKDDYLYLYTPKAKLPACHVSKPKSECESYTGWYVEEPLWQVLHLQKSDKGFQLQHRQNIEGIGNPRAIAGNYIYAVTPWQTGKYETDNYFQVISIQNRESPQIMEEYTTSAEDLKVYDKTLFGTVGNGLIAWDISTPEHPTKLDTTYNSGGQIGNFETLAVGSKTVIGKGYSLIYQRFADSVQMELFAQIETPNEVTNCRVWLAPDQQCQLQFIGKTRSAAGIGENALYDGYIFVPLGIGTRIGTKEGHFLVDFAILVYKFP